jgi:tetratricopeptide (TPR) repeat protein
VDHAELVAYHGRPALDLARATGEVDSALTERARLALREAGDRAASLHADAVAAAQYEDALALWPEDDHDRPDLLFRLGRALHRAYDPRAEEALEDARDALLTAGNADLAAETEVLLAYVAWDRGHGEETRSHLSRAHELVGASVTPAAARVLTTSARMRVISSEYETGQADAEAALAMAEDLHLDELRAHALTTIGMAKNFIADGSGIGDMEQALALALEIDSPIATAILNNLAVQAIIRGELSRSGELYAEALRVGERFGDTATIRFVRANLIWHDYMQGRWDTALTDADAFIAACEAGSPHTNEWAVRAIRARLRLARGNGQEAMADLRASVALAREKQDPFQTAAALQLLAATQAELGESTEACGHIDEIVELITAHGVHGATATFALEADKLGTVERLREAVERSPGSNVAWKDAATRILDGDLLGAAARYAAMPNPTLQAETRLHAGERLLDSGDHERGAAEIQKALKFHRSVAAAHYVRRAEEALGRERYSDSA